MSEGEGDSGDTKKRSGEHARPGTAPPVTAPPVTGWDRADSPAGPRPKRKRITLDVIGPPLALPDPPAGSALPDLAMDPPSAELSLPDLERLVLGRAPLSAEREIPSQILEDGWGRSREMPTSAPARSRASTPPPFSAAAAQSATGLTDALRLVATRSRPPGSSVLDLEGEMMDRYALGDFTGALLAAELVLGKDSGHSEAKKCAASCRERLCHLHLSRLGGATRVPRVAVDGAEVRWLGLDHRAGFLLSRVDGASTIDELVDLSGMACHEALKILVELLDAGALGF